MKSFVKTSLAGSLICCSVLLLQIGCSQQPAQQPNQTNLATSASPTPGTTEDAASPGPVAPAPAASSQEAATGAGAGAAGSTAPPSQAAGNRSAAPAEKNTAPSAVSPTALMEKPKPPRVATLGTGTPISIWTSSQLSTKTHKAGESFVGSLARPITDGDWVIAKKGARVEGVIANSNPGGRVKGRASMTLRLKSIALADGRTLDVSTSTYTKQAKATKKKDAMKIGIGAGIGAAIGAIAGGGKGAAIGAGAGGAGGTGLVMATRGDPAVIPGESQLSFRLNSPVRVTHR